MASSRFFDRQGPFSLKELAETGKAEIIGDENIMIEDVSSLQDAGEGQISFLDNRKYKDAFAATKATACIISPDMQENAPKGCHLLVSKQPYKAYALIAQRFYPSDVSPSIHATAVLEESAVIGQNVSIGAHSYIGRGVEIGDNTVIGHNVTITHALIGHKCNIYSGARIGQDGFGFAIDPAGHVKVPQLGRVMIGNGVEIGANTTIDRGAGPDTVIGDGCWIDNLVQIGHNVQIGKGCVLISQSGIAGSSELQDYVVVAAQGGVAGHLKIGSGARIGAQSGIMQDVPAGADMLGSPGMPARQHMRQIAWLRRQTNKNKG